MDIGALHYKEENQMHSVAEIEALPENVRAELVDGKIVMMAAPTDTHQLILSELHYRIADHIKKKKKDCKVFPAPYAVYLQNDNYNYYEPDISVICDQSKRDKKGCHGAPDWIIEIVSPSSRKMDCFIKLFKYRAAGVREYWTIDYEHQIVTTYFFEEEDAAYYTFEDTVEVKLCPELSINFTEIAAEL